MKKIMLALNIVLGALCLFLIILYDCCGGLMLKGITAAGFVLLGLINVLYAWLAKSDHRPFALRMLLGLTVCMIGDIVLNLSFIPGAIIFALGHILYCIAFGKLNQYRKNDFFPITAVTLLSLAILLLTPGLHFGSSVMACIVYIYALIISLMVGKAIANYLRGHSALTALQMLGAILFYFSDLMLLLLSFADAPHITDVLCLYTYFPGQCLLAHSIFHAVSENKGGEPA